MTHHKIRVLRLQVQKLETGLSCISRPCLNEPKKTNKAPTFLSLTLTSYSALMGAPKVESPISTHALNSRADVVSGGKQKQDRNAIIGGHGGKPLLCCRLWGTNAHT